MPTPNSRRSSAPRSHQPTPTHALPEGSLPGRPGSIQSGLTGAVIGFALGRLVVAAAYPQIIRADEWWWKSIMRLPGSHGEGLLAIPVWLIGMVGLIVVFLAMIALLALYYADRYYLTPFIGFAIGRGAGGPVGRALRAPWKAIGGFLAVFVLSVVDFFRYPKLSHRLASLAVLVLGLGTFVVAGRVLLPLARRDPRPATPGEEVIRFLPSASWLPEGRAEGWRVTLSEASLHKSYLELTLLTQNTTGRTRTLSIKARTHLVCSTSGVPLEGRRRLLAAEGGIPIAPAMATLQGSAAAVTRLRFERPAIPERLWHLKLFTISGRSAGQPLDKPELDLAFDLRPTGKSP